MKKIIKYSFIMFLITLGLTACAQSDSDYIKKSKISNEMPPCDNMNYINLSSSKNPAVIGWYCGDDNYEQSITGIVVKQFLNGEWQTTLNLDKYDLYAEYMQYIGKIENDILVFGVKNNYYNNDTSVRVLYYNEGYKVEKIVPAIDAAKAYVEDNFIVLKNDTQKEKYMYQNGAFIKIS